MRKPDVFSNNSSSTVERNGRYTFSTYKYSPWSISRKNLASNCTLPSTHISIRQERRWAVPVWSLSIVGVCSFTPQLANYDQKLRDFGVLQTRRDVGFKVICLASRRKGFSATRSINLAEIVPTNRSLTRE